MVGNRALPTKKLWAVVQAMEKAFPVLMSPSVDAVRAMTDDLHLTAEALALLWIQKVRLLVLYHIQLVKCACDCPQHLGDSLY